MKKFLKAFLVAINGVKICLLSEINFRIHVVAAIAAAAAGICFEVSSIEWLAITICITAVLTVEMLNTALEKLCNVVHANFHTGIKQVKDIAAGAVLVTSLMSVICGGIIFIPKIMVLIKSLS